MMRRKTLILALVVVGCSSSKLPYVAADSGVDSGVDPGTDGGTDAGTDGGTDGGTDAGVDGGTDGGTDCAAGGVLGDDCSTVACSTRCPNIVCDPADKKCKLDGTTTNIGAPCTISGQDPACGADLLADPGPVCQDEAQDGFPGGYCSVDPCSETLVCPIGSSCARLNGGVEGGCWKNCTDDSNCRTPGYACTNIDPLFLSGASHKVCFRMTFSCVANSDCPAIKPHCVVETCSP